MKKENDIRQALQALKAEDNLRRLPRITHQGRYILSEGRRMLNLSSNDYLGLSTDLALREEFLQTLTPETFLPTASSSRLLTGNHAVYEALETELAHRFGTRAALVLGSGYHANTGILPAVCDKETLLLADKLVHASLIDGIRLSTARCIRYRHNDLEQVRRLLEQYHTAYRRIIIVTESIFSMDGDEADLKALVALKRLYNNVWLYLDEAHAFGVRGRYGLGCAEAAGCLRDIDLLVGTFGKAAASAGAFVVCKSELRDYLVNRMRTLIYSTALPPLNIAWTLFVVRRMAHMQARRDQLTRNGDILRHALSVRKFNVTGSSHIVPLIVGPSDRAIQKAQALQQGGFYVLPVRPPTVPEGTSRLRISLTAAVKEEEIHKLVACLVACRKAESGRP
ncbi:MAG: 8-amino-7-oxononanoate synthase [Prevotellaceae bacterium]|nr:8-amino-7-oxononanoate synthase [Prevotellaceae bacterium]